MDGDDIQGFPGMGIDAFNQNFISFGVLRVGADEYLHALTLPERSLTPFSMLIGCPLDESEPEKFIPWARPENNLPYFTISSTSSI